ncbi:unnamed protein product [Brachionus calyciflorus]|uniref:Ricin B lectin domain-containing protein n=1 Tax=Brachionus calyciflorus TaxID=104777 RepID=A0A813XTS4_9BILA|nr:unnamed protein product [Brachionus calyciflorus]
MFFLIYLVVFCLILVENVCYCWPVKEYKSVRNSWHREYFGNPERITAFIVCKINEDCTITQTYTHTVTHSFSIGLDLGVKPGELFTLAGIKLNYQISFSDATATSYAIKLKRNSVGALYFTPRLFEFGGFYSRTIYTYGLDGYHENTKDGDFKITTPTLVGNSADGKWEIRYFDVNWNQFWTWEDKGNGYFRIVNRRSGKCLDVDDHRVNTNGAIIQQWSCHNYDNQLWFKWYRYDNNKDGTFHIVNKKSRKCIDVPRWDRNNGVRIHQWQCLDQPNQKWQLHSNGLKNLNSEKCLDLPDLESYEQGARIQQWECVYVEKDHKY